jgi:A/G-specific adenine glycosylase
LKKHRIRHFQKQLMNWYAICHRPLPWRKTSDPYLVWVSEVMLQQTQVKTVVPYYQKFVRRFPDIHLLAKTDLEDVLKTWEGLGYYARARNLHKASGIIVKKYGGVLPDDFQLLRKLPGIGEYIASAVSSIAFGQPFAVVDGNVKRVLARLNAIDLPVNRSTSNTVFKGSADRLLARNDPGEFNQAMMELGALVCTPKRPDCGNCPVKRSCEAFRSNAVDHYPKRVKATRTPQFHIATGVVCKGQKVLITRRKLEGLLGGLWEFPGGKIRKDETAETACIREIKEEVSLKVKTDEHLTRIRHAYTHFKIVMDVFLCSYVAGRIRLNGPIDFQWIRTAQIDDYPFPGANHKFIPLLIDRLRKSAGSQVNVEKRLYK